MAEAPGSLVLLDQEGLDVRRQAQRRNPDGSCQPTPLPVPQAAQPRQQPCQQPCQQKVQQQAAPAGIPAGSGLASAGSALPAPSSNETVELLQFLPVGSEEPGGDVTEELDAASQQVRRWRKAELDG